MTCKFCDGCGIQIPVRDSYADRLQKYSIKMAVQDTYETGVIDHERFLKFCPECRAKVEAFLDKFQSERPLTVSATLTEE